MKMLIVVDMQRDFVTDVLGSKYAQEIVPNVVAKVKEYLTNGDRVIFTIDSHQEDTYLKTREGRWLPVPHCINSTEGQMLIPELDEIFNEYCNSGQIMLMHKVDQFGLPIYGLDNPYDYPEVIEGLEGFEFIGVATNMCVISCVICSQNIYRNHEHVVDASCCASFDSILHEKALDVMEAMHIKVINR